MLLSCALCTRPTFWSVATCETCHWVGCALYTVLPVGVKFQSDFIVYNECLFMSRNIDLNYIKCFKEGSVVLNLSQSSSLELSVTCRIFSLGVLLSHVQAHTSVRFLLVLPSPPLKVPVILPFSFQLCVTCVSCSDIKLCSLNLNCRHFPSLFWFPTTCSTSTPQKTPQVTRPLHPVIQKPLTSSFPLPLHDAAPLPQSIRVFLYLVSNQGLLVFPEQYLFPCLPFFSVF